MTAKEKETLPHSFHCDPGLALSDETGTFHCFIGFDGQTRHLSDLVVESEAVALLGIGIVGELQMKHQIHHRVVVLDSHAGEDFLRVAVPSAHQRLMVLGSINEAFVVFAHEVDEGHLDGILLFGGQTVEHLAHAGEAFAVLKTPLQTGLILGHILVSSNN